MASAESVKDKIESLIYTANSITKKDDTTLVDAMLRLLSGYNASEAVNAAIKMYGIDPSVASISGGDFVQLITKWGTFTAAEECSAVAVVPLSASKLIVIHTDTSEEIGVYAQLFSADGPSVSSSLPILVHSNARTGAPFAAVALSDTKVLLVCQHGDRYVAGVGPDADSGIAYVLSVEGDTLSASESVTFSNSIGRVHNLTLTALTNSKALVVCRNANGYGYAMALTVEGTTVTAGAALNFDSSVRNPRAVALTDSKALIAYETYDGSNGRAIVLVCPGTTVTKGSAYTFRSASTSDLALTALDQRRAVLVYRDAATTGYLTATILQVTDATVTTQNSPSLQLTDYGGNKPEVTRIGADTALVVANFSFSDSSSEIMAHVLTISESKITKGAALALHPNSTREEPRAVATMPDGSAVVAIGNRGSGSMVFTMVNGLDIDGTTVSYQTSGGSFVVPLTTTKYPIGVAKTSGVPGDILFVYRAGEPATE